jgi:hypothetical protein
VGVVAAGEVLRADAAKQHEGRTRIHIVAVEVQMRDSAPTCMSFEGWASLKQGC